MEKCVLIVRVSSDKQGTESQKLDLVRFAKLKENGGWSDDPEQMKIIENKESATKKEELKGLKELKEYIKNNNVKAVFAWELSRLSRRWEVLNELGTLFVRNKINFICAHPNIKLLDNDGNLDPVAAALYDNTKNMAANEVRIRTESSLRGIRDAASKNLFLGGSVILGYKVVPIMIDGLKKQKCELDPDTQKIVFDIFELYKSGQHSFSSIAKIIEREYKKVLNRNQIGDILANEYYVGEKIKTDKHVFERQYPPIIDIDTYNAVQTLLKQRSGRKSDKSRNIYYASRLIKCSNCGSTLVAFHTSNNYQCKNFLEKKGCTKGTSINIDVADSLSLEAARIKDITVMANLTEDEINNTHKRIEKLHSKINESEKQLNVIREKRLKKYIKDFSSYMTESEIINNVERSLAEDKHRIDKENIADKNEIERMKNWLNRTKIDKLGKYSSIIVTATDYPKIDTKEQIPNDHPIHKERYNLVKTYIKSIEVINIDTFIKEITITTYCNDVSKWQYHTKAKGNENRLFLYRLHSLKKGYIWAPMKWDKIVIPRFKRN